MVSQRNRILELKQYLTTIGIDINIGKNKARGHKGIFMHTPDAFRIDVSKNLDDENILSVLLHEFAHYLHYTYDSKLKSLDFIFGEFSDEIKEELIKVTVLDVPKDFAASLYGKKNELNSEISELASRIRQKYPEFKISESNKSIERGLTLPLKYLLKYDRVRIFNKLISIDNLDTDFSLDDVQKDYIILKSKQRMLRRINSRINKLNKYYNNPTELFARFVERYYTQPEKVKNIAPKSCEKMRLASIPELHQIELILSNNL